MSKQARVLTLYEPWAALMRVKLKKVETRGYKTNYRGPLIIHASKTINEDEFSFWSKGRLKRYHLCPGHVVAVCQLVDCIETNDIARQGIYPWDSNGEHLSQLIELLAGNYDYYRYGWYTEGLIALQSPIPHRGTQGMPWASEELIVAINDQVGEDWLIHKED